MVPTGFEPVVGQRFTFQTKPAGAWDGVIHCEVLEAEERFGVRVHERRLGDLRSILAFDESLHVVARSDVATI